MRENIKFVPLMEEMIQEEIKDTKKVKVVFLQITNKNDEGARFNP